MGRSFPTQGVSFSWLKGVCLPHQEFCFYSLECKKKKKKIVAKKGCDGMEWW